jgi:drug/metabolite transporter (DMT)-like permease
MELSGLMRLPVILAYAGMCLIWGTTWLAIKVGLHTLGPLTGVGVRFTIAGVLLAIVAAWRGKLLPLREYPWGAIAVLAVALFGLPYVLTYSAETQLDSGLVSVLFGTFPFFTFLFGALMIGERATPLVWVGAAGAFAGVAIISLTGDVRGSIPYALCAVAGAAFSAYGNVFAKQNSRYDPLITLPPSMILSGLVFTAAGSLVERTDWHAVLGLQSLGALLYLAICGSGVAFFLMMWLLARIPAYVVGFATLIFPIIALAAGALLGGEHVGLRELLGSALVIGGLALTIIPTSSVETRSETI